MKNFDLAVIGGGPGGYVAAIRAAQLGMRTVLFERSAIGGTCLNVGCIPTKTFYKNAEIMREIASCAQRGIRVSAPAIDMPAVVGAKNAVVERLASGVGMLLKANNVEVISAQANVRDGHTIAANGELYGFRSLIIATGSSNSIPPIPGLEDKSILTSTGLLDIDHVPESLAIIGGGVIGCEFASIFAAFGTKVTIIEMMPRLIPAMDADIAAALTRVLKSSGVSVKTAQRITGVQNTGDGFMIRFDDESAAFKVEQVLVSAGRRPNLTGFKALELKLSPKNYITVDEHMRTSAENVYAVGDITGTIQLAHVASAQGIVAAENIAGIDRVMSYDIVPSCVFTIPEIGSVGLSEEAARTKYGDVTVGVFPMAASGKALTMGMAGGFTKIIADRPAGKVVGAHIIGPNATEIIGQLASVMHFGGTLDDIMRTIHAHPTITETILESAHMAIGRPIHMPPSR